MAKVLDGFQAKTLLSTLSGQSSPQRRAKQVCPGRDLDLNTLSECQKTSFHHSEPIKAEYSNENSNVSIISEKNPLR